MVNSTRMAGLLRFRGIPERDDDKGFDHSYRPYLQASRLA